MTVEAGPAAAPARRPHLPRAGAGASAAAGILLLLISPLLPGAAPAQEAGGALPPDTGTAAAPDDARVDSLTTDVADQLRCPVCRSQSVLESSSDLANRMQALIRERVARGDSPAEIRAYFVDKYGEWILLKPEPEGLNLLVYILPAAALVGGGWAVVRRLRKWSDGGVTDGATGGTGSTGGGRGPGGAGGASDDPDGAGDPSPGPDDLSDEDRDWLQRELDRRR